MNGLCCYCDRTTKSTVTMESGDVRPAHRECVRWWIVRLEREEAEMRREAAAASAGRLAGPQGVLL